MGPRYDTRSDKYGTNHYVLDNSVILPNGESGIIAICKKEARAKFIARILNEAEQQGEVYHDV